MTRIKRLKDYGFKTENRTYVIAEIGINHGGDIALAQELIAAAARAGADAVKFQTYLTEKRAPKGNQVVFDILKKCELPFKAFKQLKDFSAAKGVDFFSTPFDNESVEYLDSIDCDLYKIASFDIVNRALLRAVAGTGKPVILSVGMSSPAEIDEAYNILKEGTKNLSLLHCISAYPTKEADSNLAAIYGLQDRYDAVIGHSDHTNNIYVPLYAVAAGAQVIEKHFMIDDQMDCIDAPVSITEAQLRDMTAEIWRIEKIFGVGEQGVRETEKGTLPFRRFSE